MLEYKELQKQAGKEVGGVNECMQHTADTTPLNNSTLHIVKSWYD